MNDTTQHKEIDIPESEIQQPPKRRIWLRVITQLSIIIFFVTMMTFLFRDYLMPPDLQSPLKAVDDAGPQKPWRDYEEWMEIKFVTLPIEGASYVAVTQIPDSTDYSFTARYIMHPKGAVEAEAQVRFEIAARLDKSYSLDQFDLLLRLPGRNLAVRGLLDNQTLYYGIKKGGEGERMGSLPLKGNLSFLDGLHSMLPRQMELAVGKEYRFRAFDPIWNFSGGDVVMKVATVEFVKIEDVEYEVYRVDFKFQNLVTSTWVTKDGQTVKRKVGNMLEMDLTTPNRVSNLPGFGDPLVPPEYVLDDFVLYMDSDSQTGGKIGLFGLLGELMKTGNNQ
jgi:hypothetical protein